MRTHARHGVVESSMPLVCHVTGVPNRPPLAHRVDDDSRRRFIPSSTSIFFSGFGVYSRLHVYATDHGYHHRFIGGL